MTACRSWPETLWPASFKGFPFQVEGESEEGGRSIVTHEFPGRNDPFLEDMGESARTFDVSAYLASDVADVEALAFMAVLASEGPGLLVLPQRGPVMARAVKPFRRQTSKDRLGYVAFSLRFLREGASSPFVSVDAAANMIFVAADAAVATLRG
jgi:prophage DNA circulation protein